jgi:2-oxoisovalerate ferredoxin oxidoreductase beta subunit
MSENKTVLRKPGGFNEVYHHKPGREKDRTHYCPGCGHGIVHKILAEALEDFEVTDRTVMISPVGCSVFVYYYFDTGNFQVAHGRAPAVGTAISRAHPDSIVISYQGDGDLAAIGGNNILQAANRGENIMVVFINNAIYGMTGGQMAPTTLEGQKTTTTPYGRNPKTDGYPMKMCEVISQLYAQRREHQEDPRCAEEGPPERGREEGLLLRGGAEHVSQRLEDPARQGPGVDRDEDAP